MGAVAPVLDPEAVRITYHALERYVGRRDTTSAAAEAGLRRLLTRAARLPTPPLRLGVGEHGPHRIARVGGFALVFDSDMTALLTLWRSRSAH